ncbi:hypothetical protein N0V84_000944 [Fusarium piperis]|uniref:FAD-binding domain-containing protein n=1 Tax=Fusarium piperis TaxID=1435070 RepID=A0A9W8WLZ2_9HYPO|nr:hypothetical protein N0V84_000944 [Fusarium piperis]
MDNSERTVIIAGGSVAGLSLANMLEKRGIRYVVLEAYDEIAPQVGASIGLHPSALRILDQLGCAEDLLSLIDIPLNESNVRNADVESVTELDQGVEVRTTKGEVYRGDILVGADGIYSTVRKEMWRIGNETSPGYFHPDEWSKVPCSYKCIFGISHPIKTLPSGVHYVYNRNFSYLVIVGPGGRVYWFLFVELPTPLFGRQIPRYTKSDEERLAKEHASDQITPNTRFGQLYEAKMNSTLTPLHEYAFEKWYFNRIITIGDAAHKFEPLTGHGGNSAIGTAASLMNHLFPDECPKWNDAHISAAFKAVQDDRFDRVSWLIKDAHETQRMQAMATPIQAVLTPILPYFISNETTLRLAASKFVGANHLNNIPLPQRDHTVPFNDELPAQPLSSFKWASAGLGVLSQGCLCWLSGRALRHSPVPTTFGSASLIKKWTGIQGIDSVLSVLVAAFGVPLTSPKEAPLVQWLSFIPLVFSTTLDWTVQSYRAGSAGLLTSW